jgi:hypothetical protein
MKFHTYLLLCLFQVFAGNSTYAQHNHATTDTLVQLQFAPVLNTFLSDPDLQKFQMQSSLMTVPPSLIDTVSHRHDADLFGYVIEGALDFYYKRRQTRIRKDVS